MKLERKTLEEVADVSLGKMLDEKKNKGELRPYLANLNVRWGVFDLQNLRKMRFEPHEFDRYGLKPGDIVMCEGGEPGRCAIWKGDVPGMMIQKALHRIRPHAGIDHRFLFYCLVHQGKSGGFDRFFTGSTIKHLPREKVVKVEVHIPPLSVQGRIASILGAYDDLIDVNRRRITLLEEMARRLYEEWFVRFRFPGHEHHAMIETPDGLIPKQWRRGVLGDLIGLAYGRALKADTRVPGDVAVIGSSGIVGWHNEALVKGPGIIVGRKGNVGAIVWSPFDFYPIDTVFFVETSCPLLFVLHQLRRLVFLNSDAAVPGLNRNAALRIPLIVPPTELMTEYHVKVAPVLDLADRLRQSNSLLAASRDALLPRLISGDVSVSSAVRELEAVA